MYTHIMCILPRACTFGQSSSSPKTKIAEWSRAYCRGDYHYYYY